MIIISRQNLQTICSRSFDKNLWLNNKLLLSLLLKKSLQSCIIYGKSPHKHYKIIEKLGSKRWEFVHLFRIINGRQGNIIPQTHMTRKNHFVHITEFAGFYDWWLTLIRLELLRVRKWIDKVIPDTASHV